MNFNVGIYPVYGFVLGVNWSKTDYLDEEETIPTNPSCSWNRNPRI
jgi:hypothetical protein